MSAAAWDEIEEIRSETGRIPRTPSQWAEADRGLMEGWPVPKREPLPIVEAPVVQALTPEELELAAEEGRFWRRIRVRHYD